MDVNQSTQPQVALVGAEPSFLSQVLMYFGLAVLTSAAGTYVGFNYLIPYFIASPGMMWGLFALELILVFTSRMWSTVKPVNYFLFTLFAFITGVTIVPLLLSVIIEFGGPDIVIKAFLVTTITFSASAMFGWVTGRNLLGLRGFLMMSLIGLIVVSIMGIFIPWGNTIEMIVAGIGVMIFTGYTMYDFQQLKMWPKDRPLDAALNLYLDIFNLFIYILRLLGGIKRN